MSFSRAILRMSLIVATFPIFRTEVSALHTFTRGIPSWKRESEKLPWYLCLLVLSTLPTSGTSTMVAYSWLTISRLLIYYQNDCELRIKLHTYFSLFRTQNLMFYGLLKVILPMLTLTWHAAPANLSLLPLNGLFSRSRGLYFRVEILVFRYENRPLLTVFKKQGQVTPEQHL